MAEKLSSYATFMLVDYPTHRVPQGLVQMALDDLRLRKIRGLLFWKLGGTGGGLGFSARFNWNRHAFFATWASQESWENFLNDSRIVEGLRRHAREFWWVALAPIQSRGAWNGQALFDIANGTYSEGPVAVLTRATIRLSRVLRFWSEVDSVNLALEGAKGRICSIGFGEIPWVRQATFSVWRSAEDFEAFAYGNEHHKRVIERTRKEGWYAEELFARFRPVASEGFWNGRNPLEGWL